MPVGFMREATPAGREGRSAVRMGNGARSGPQVTAPSGGDTQEMVLHDHTGSHPHREPAKGGRAPGCTPASAVRGSRHQEKPRAARPCVGGAGDGPVLGGGLGFPDLSLW